MLLSQFRYYWNGFWHRLLPKQSKISAGIGDSVRSLPIYHFKLLEGFLAPYLLAVFPSLCGGWNQYDLSLFLPYKNKTNKSMMLLNIRIRKEVTYSSTRAHWLAPIFSCLCPCSYFLVSLLLLMCNSRNEPNQSVETISGWCHGLQNTQWSKWPDREVGWCKCTLDSTAVAFYIDVRLLRWSGKLFLSFF